MCAQSVDLGTHPPFSCPSFSLSSRAERPDFLFRAAVWRVGSRSRGISPSPWRSAGRANFVSRARTRLSPRRHILYVTRPITPATLPCFCVCRGNKGLMGEWLASRGNKGVSRRESEEEAKDEGV